MPSLQQDELRETSRPLVSATILGAGGVLDIAALLRNGDPVEIVSERVQRLAHDRPPQSRAVPGYGEFRLERRQLPH